MKLSVQKGRTSLFWNSDATRPWGAVHEPEMASTSSAESLDDLCESLRIVMGLTPDTVGQNSFRTALSVLTDSLCPVAEMPTGTTVEAVDNDFPGSRMRVRLVKVDCTSIDGEFDYWMNRKIHLNFPYGVNKGNLMEALDDAAARYWNEVACWRLATLKEIADCRDSLATLLANIGRNTDGKEITKSIDSINK